MASWKVIVWVHISSKKGSMLVVGKLETEKKIPDSW